MNAEGPASLVVHASCVAAGERGLLIMGKSGAGKSALALQLIAFGAALVADDRVALTIEDDTLIARCPGQAIRGMIEARGFGLLHVETQVSADRSWPSTWIWSRKSACPCVTRSRCWEGRCLLPMALAGAILLLRCGCT